MSRRRYNRLLLPPSSTYLRHASSATLTTDTHAEHTTARPQTFITGTWPHFQADCLASRIMASHRGPRARYAASRTCPLLPDCERKPPPLLPPPDRRVCAKVLTAQHL